MGDYQPQPKIPLMLQISDLPRKNGFPVGAYRIRYGATNLVVQGAKFVDGTNVEAVSGRVLQRLAQAWGVHCTIEPWDEETEEIVLQHNEDCRRPARVKELQAAFKASKESASEPSRSDAKKPTKAQQKKLDEQAEARRAEEEANLAAQAAGHPTPGQVQADRDVAGMKAEKAEKRSKAQKKKAKDEEERRREQAAQMGKEQDLTEVVPKHEPTIDDDVDGIDDEDILRAMAAGLAVDTEGLDIPELKVAIRKARQE